MDTETQHDEVRRLWRARDVVAWGDHTGTVTADEQPGIYVAVRYEGTDYMAAVPGDQLQHR